MKTIKFLFLTLFILCFCFTTQAQEKVEETKKKSGFFVRVNGGYGFEGIDAVQGQDLTATSATNIYGSSAPGLNLGIGVGYMFNKFVGIDLGVYYTFGKEKFTEVVQEDLPLGLVGGSTEFTVLEASIFQKYTNRTTQLRITPALIVRGGDGKIAPYARVGLVIPVAGKTSTTVDGTLTTSEIPTNIGGIPIPGFDSGVSLVGTVDAEAETSGSFSVGFDASLGLDYRITNTISIFGEVNMTALTIRSKETNVSKYDGVYSLQGSPLSLEDLADGINTAADLANVIPGVNFGDFSYDALGLYENIDEVPASENQIIYVDELNSETNNPAYNSAFDEDQAMDELVRRENFSSIGINIGLKFNF